VGQAVDKWNGGFNEPDAEWQRLLTEAAGLVSSVEVERAKVYAPRVRHRLYARTSSIACTRCRAT